jgi:hypothetical protein
MRLYWANPKQVSRKSEQRRRIDLNTSVYLLFYRIRKTKKNKVTLVF